MNKNFVIKRCNGCGALVIAIHDCDCGDCGIKCCGKNMEELKPNSVDAAFEKHVPTFEVSDGKIKVRVNHVMDEDHYIEWIACVTENSQDLRYFNPGDEAIAEFDYNKGAKLYAYCNKHALWESEIK